MAIPTHEYAPFYAGYISQIPNGDFPSVLHEQLQSIPAFFSQFSDEQAMFRYADGKWSIKELLGHINDGERVFAYRAMRIGRGDTTPLPGFEQDGYVVTANADRHTLADLIEEFKTIRAASISLYKTLSEDDLLRMGTASGAPMSTRALFTIICGHVKHHIEIIEQKYIPNM